MLRKASVWGMSSWWIFPCLPFWMGRPAKTVAIAGEIRVVAITRKSKTFLPDGNTALRSDDLLHLAVLSSSMDRLKSLF